MNSSISYDQVLQPQVSANDVNTYLGTQKNLEELKHSN